jgi:2-hydroxy-3-oxopropionate reductase
MAEIGFVGLGMMGNPMAQNLIRAGHRVRVYDVRSEPFDELRALGAEVARDPESLAACNPVFVMVNTGPQVEQVLAGIAAGTTGGKGPLVVVMSTISPDLLNRLALEMIGKGITVIDAPVSGAPILAQTAGLSIMVGADSRSFETILPYLKAMGQAIRHIGPPGMGLAMKLVNNLVGIANGYVLNEALKIGLASGLDIRTMVEMIRASSGNNWVVENWDAYIGFMALMAGRPEMLTDFHHTAEKDIQTVREWTIARGLRSPVVNSVLSILQQSDAMTIDAVSRLLTAANSK